MIDNEKYIQTVAGMYCPAISDNYVWECIVVVLDIAELATTTNFEAGPEGQKNHDFHDCQGR